MAQGGTVADRSAAAVRELVESAIESDDVGPLVKAVFEVQPPGEAVPLPLPRGSESATTSQGGDAAAAGQGPANVLDAVLEALAEVAEEKDAEIAQICRANAPEIAAAMHELGAMQRDAAALRQQLLANNASIQDTGAAFAARLEEAREVAALQRGMAAARKAVGSALAVLQLCARAAQCIEAKQLFKAYKLLEAIQRDHGALLRGGYDARPLLPGTPGSTAGGAAGAGGPGSRETSPIKPGLVGPAGTAAVGGGGTPLGGPAAAGAAGAAAAAGGGGGAEQLGPLAAFLRERVAELAAALEQRAIADFNNWLSSVRAQARTIGQRAVRWAASERQHEEQLSRQRKLLLPRLEGVGDLRAAGALVAAALRAPELRDAAPVTPLQLPPGGGATPPVAVPAAGVAAAAAAGRDSSPAGSTGSAGSNGSPPGGRMAGFRAARQAASSPSRLASEAGAAAAMPPGTAVSSSRAAAAAAAAAGAAEQTPPVRGPRGRHIQRSDTFAVTGDLLAGVDMAPLHRCVHIHACLGRLPQFADYYAHNRRQQLAADLALQGDFLEHYQSYLAQLVGFFLVEDAVQQQAAGAAGEPLDIVAQVDAAWEAAVAALKALLEPAFRGATAAPAMLTVKDFMLLACLALDHCGYQTIAVREMLTNSRPKYLELLGAATAAAVQAAVACDSLAAVEVKSAARADELFRQLALPPTFHAEDAENKRPPFKAPFSSMVPELARIIRGHVVDSIAYLKGLLTAGEVASAARQAPDRQLTRIVCDALQQRVDAAAGDTALPVDTALQLVANIASLIHSLGSLEEFALGQARGDTPETVAAAAEAAQQAAARSRSASPGRSRSRSRSPGKGQQARGRQQQGGEAAAAASGSRERRRSRASSAGSAPSPPRSPPPAPGQQQQHAAPASSQLSGHTVVSFSASGGAPAASGASGSAAGRPGSGGSAGAAPPGSSAAAFQGLLESAEALVVRSVSARAAGWLAEGERLDWAPAEQASSIGGLSPHIEELVLYLKECASLLARMAPGPSCERMLRGALRYVADATMLLLMSDAVPEFNLFGLQRLFNDLGGISRAAGSMGVPGLADELAEPLLFCEMLVFGSLEELLDPELRAGPKYAAMNLRRACLVLDKYREVDKASGLRAMHKSRQAERFISRKTVDRVLRELREGGSRPASRASSSTGSLPGMMAAPAMPPGGGGG